MPEAIRTCGKAPQRAETNHLPPRFWLRRIAGAQPEDDPSQERRQDPTRQSKPPGSATPQGSARRITRSVAKPCATPPP